MQLREAQVDAMAGATMDAARRERLLELRDKGLDVREDPKTKEILVRDKAGHVCRVESLGLKVRVKSPEGGTTEVEQYSSGRVKTITDAGGRQVKFERDNRGFLTAIDRGPTGGTVGFQLNKAWQPLRIDYPDGTTTSTEYTADGSPARVTNRDGTKIGYEYTPANQLAAIADPQGRTTKFTYPETGPVRVVEFPNGVREEYIADAETGAERLVINGKTHAEYRGEDGTIQVSYHDGTQERFVFKDGRLVEAENRHAVVKFAYDADGRLLSDEVNGEAVKFLRNEVGAIVGVVTPIGEKITYVRDRDQRLTEVVDWNERRYRIRLPLDGSPTELEYPNGVRVTTGGNAMGLPAAWKVARADAGTLDEAAWGHDTCDRLVSATRFNVRRDYKYDKAGRLNKIQSADTRLNETFDFDACANPRGSSADPTNRLLRHGNRSFAYDERGNQISDQGSQSRTCQYDAAGRLTKVLTGGRAIEYKYDPIGRRIAKTVDGVATKFSWAGTQLIAEIKVEGKKEVRRDYLYCAEYMTPLAFREDKKVYGIHSGRMQEPLCVTDEAGAVVWQADYQAFGKARLLVDRVRLPLRLPGQYHDDETGLHYNVARYYDPELGRFLSLDPARSGGASCNYYAYCDGDPINRVDPTGEIGAFLTGVLIGAGIGLVVGAVIGAGIELYKQRNNEKTDWGAVGKAAAVGALVGAVGGAVGAAATAALVPVLGVVAAGAVAGGLSAGVEYCVEVAVTDTKFEWSQLGLSVAVGTTIGAVTAGLGGVFAARAARKAAAAAAAKKVAQEIEEEAAKKLLREAEEEAAKKLAKKAEEEAAEKALKKAAAEKAEQAAKQKALASEAADGGHSVDRHGPDVTDAQLKDRITTGVAPDGKFSPTSTSSKFKSHEDWVKTKDAAFKDIEATNGVDLSKPPQPGQPTKYKTTVDHGTPVGDGFQGTGTKTNTTVTDPVTGQSKTGKVSPGTQEVKDMTKTTTTVEWNPTTNKWETKQHFPTP